MKLMVKTDRCVELLKEILLGLWPYCFKFHGSDELVRIIKEADNKGEAIREYYRDKTGKERFSANDEAIRHVFDKEAVFQRLAFLKTLSFYVLSPMVEIANKEEQVAFAKECTKNDLYQDIIGAPHQDIILNTIERFGEPIYVKELEDEFMDVCPDPDSIGKYLAIARTKFSDLSFPYRNGCSMADLVFKDNVYYRNIRKAESVGLITQHEAEGILVSIWQVIREANKMADRIVEMYAKIESMMPSEGSNDANIQTPENTQCAHFSVAKSYEDMQRILAALQQGGFVSTDTATATFYYRMTGSGAPVQDRIIWTKKGRNKAISLTSLIDFVVTIGVSLKASLREIDGVFCRENGSDINLPDATKSSVKAKYRHNQDLSVDHAAIKAIIGEE